MATAILSPVPIPGLHTMPTKEDLAKTTKMYNTLPHDGDQPPIARAHLDDLLQLLVTNGVENKFGIHLVHGHLQVDEGKIMFGKALNAIDTKVPGIWTRPTNITELDSNNIHGHIFALKPDNQFMAYEYREGPPPALDSNDNAFITTFATFLQKNNLANLFGLQVLSSDGANLKTMQEFDISGGSPEGVVMLDAEDTNIEAVYRVTGWSAVTDKATGITKLHGNDLHAEKTDGSPKIFIDTELSDEKSLMDILKRESIIN